MKNYKYYRLIFIFILAATLASAYFMSVSAAVAAYLKIEQSGILMDSSPDFAEFNREVFLQTDDTVSFNSIDPEAAGEYQAAEIWKIISKYSAAGKYIVEQAAAAHGADAVGAIGRWLVGAGPDSLFMNLSYAAHEEYHFFQHYVSPERADVVVWNAGRQMTGDRVVCVPFKNYLPVTTVIRTIDLTDPDAEVSTFDTLTGITDGDVLVPSAQYAQHARDGGFTIIVTGEATNRIPANLRTVRWEMYVSPDSVLDSNIKGAYGLLNEFGAYYYGYKAAADCCGYVVEYLNANGYSQDLTFGYLASVSDALSFYEFKYWTLEYLIYLKNHYPKHYSDLLHNGPFLRSFIYFHDNFEELVEVIIPKTNETIIDTLISMGLKSWEDDDAVWIGKNGVGKQTETIRLLKNQMALPEYTLILEELRNANISY